MDKAIITTFLKHVTVTDGSLLGVVVVLAVYGIKLSLEKAQHYITDLLHQTKEEILDEIQTTQENTLSEIKAISSIYNESVELARKAIKTHIEAVIKAVKDPAFEFKAQQNQIIEDLKRSLKEFEIVINTLKDIKTNNEADRYQFFMKIDKLFDELKEIVSDINSLDKNTEKVKDVMDKIKEFLHEINTQLKYTRS